MQVYDFSYNIQQERHFLAKRLDHQASDHSFTTEQHPNIKLRPHCSAKLLRDWTILLLTSFIPQKRPCPIYQLPCQLTCQLSAMSAFHFFFLVAHQIPLLPTPGAEGEVMWGSAVVLTTAKCPSDEDQRPPCKLPELRNKQRYRHMHCCRATRLHLQS